MSIECTCCKTFECERRAYIQDNIEQVPFRMDPASLGKFKSDMIATVYADRMISVDTFRFLGYGLQS
jgi:hypothetical protein